MRQRIVALGAGMLLAVACSLINATDDLKPVEPIDTGGTSGGMAPGEGGDGGTANLGGSAKPGDGAGASTGGAGASTGGGGAPSSGGEGGVPPIGRECDDSRLDCASTAPICDKAEGACRACANDPECKTDLGLNFCSKLGPNRGRCLECRMDDDCSGTTPVCGSNGRCEACTEHEQCGSKICAPTGACADSSVAVYALAETGSTNMACGTLDDPCRFVSTAVGKLTPTRPNLVLLSTSAIMSDGSATFPAFPGLPLMRVIGNGVVVHPYTGQAAFIVPAGANVLFDDVVLEGSVGNPNDPAGVVVGAIQCTGGKIEVQNSVLRDSASGVMARDCDVTVSSSLIQHNAAPVPFGGGGVVSTCTTANGQMITCAKKLEIRRNRFIDNGVAAYNTSQAEATYENNLFLRNGADGYTRVIELRAAHTRFAYNTLVENFNGCSYVGIVACDAGICDDIANISFRSFPAAMPPCYDQVWYQGSVSYSLTEVAYPGSTNRVGDPLFVDVAGGNFTPGPGSPALDHGKPMDAPLLDIDGRPRPPGSPDIGAFEAP